jgi:hypothetical protein
MPEADPLGAAPNSRSSLSEPTLIDDKPAAAAAQESTLIARRGHSPPPALRAPARINEAYPPLALQRDGDGPVASMEQQCVAMAWRAAEMHLESTCAAWSAGGRAHGWSDAARRLLRCVQASHESATLPMPVAVKEADDTWRQVEHWPVMVEQLEQTLGAAPLTATSINLIGSAQHDRAGPRSGRQRSLRWSGDKLEVRTHCASWTANQPHGLPPRAAVERTSTQTRGCVRPHG